MQAGNETNQQPQRNMPRHIIFSRKKSCSCGMNSTKLNTLPSYLWNSICSSYKQNDMFVPWNSDSQCRVSKCWNKLGTPSILSIAFHRAWPHSKACSPGNAGSSMNPRLPTSPGPKLRPSSDKTSKGQEYTSHLGMVQKPYRYEYYPR